MFLTKPQQILFWREWSVVKRLLSSAGWTDDEIEQERHAALSRAGFPSLTKVDKLAGFDRVLAEVKALSHPSDLDAQLRQQEMPRTRLVYAIRKLADEPYIVALAGDRFQSSDWTALDLSALNQLRFTLADRAVSHHRTSTGARRSAATQARRAATQPDPDARINFPAAEFQPAPETADCPF